MFSPSVTNLYCPGCAPGDVAMPHICGITKQSIFPFFSTPQPPLGRCSEHCFCGDEIRNNKPHESCCMCGTRRVKAKAED